MFHTCGTFRGTFYIVHYITNTLWNILMFYNRGTSWNILWLESWEPGQLARVLSSSETTPGKPETTRDQEPGKYESLLPGAGPDQKKCNIFAKSL